MKEVLNVGVIGLGNRGSNLLENCILPQPGVRVLAVCDNYEDRREKGMQRKEHCDEMIRNALEQLLHEHNA